jgi:hypothetical protein
MVRPIKVEGNPDHRAAARRQRTETRLRCPIHTLCPSHLIETTLIASFRILGFETLLDAGCDNFR